LTEEKLIQHCKQGKRDAQEYLYRNFAPVLFGVCLKYSKSRTDAEDNLHDSFMTIYEKIHQFKHKGSFEGWLKRITVNTVLQKYRKDLLVLSEPDFKEVEDIAYTNSYEDIPIAKLLQHVQELPHKYRITFNMYVLDGYSHKEISEALGTSEGTSKSNLARARAILKEKIKHTAINIT
jgi:RNA polymerase sigma factor (sigma-70 family)